MSGDRVEQSVAPTEAIKASVDPLEGQEIRLLNAMLAAIHQQARTGDPEMIDRVIKILALKRALKRDREEEL